MFKSQHFHKIWQFGKIVLITCILTLSLFKPLQAQIIPSLQFPTSQILLQSNEIVKSACIYLDGRCIFQLSTLDSESETRISEIQSRLDNVKKIYLTIDPQDLKITENIESSLPNIYIEIKGKAPIRLLTVTNPDAQIKGVSLTERTQQLIDILNQSLQQAKKERTQAFLTNQSLISTAILLIIIIVNFIFHKILVAVKKKQKEFTPIIGENEENKQVISNLLIQRKNWNFKEVQLRSLQLLQTGIIGGGIVFILGLFPYTRMIQFLTIVLLQYPLRIVIVAVVTYVLIRLSYALIAQFNSVLALNSLISPEGDRRLKLRITTLSVVIRSIVTGTWLIIGILLGLALIGINITPLLAGAGIIGLVISFASQNLIKDAINGFCIILEDQYAVGDVININNYSGLVENINLRITQIRDSEGKLITIPNSEVKIVANSSSNWSRADVNIPLAYHADITKALGVIKAVANNMNHDLEWQEKILEEPAVLGIENFSDKGMMIRVLIKTEPLKQWEIAREFRRRIKIAFDEENIPIPLPQQQL